MSFATDIKAELCKIEASTCCKIAECYGILLFGRAFSVHNMIVATECEDVVTRLSFLLGRCYGIQPNISVGGNCRDYFTATLQEKNKIKEIYNSFGYYGFKDGDLIIKSHNFEDDCCKSAFLRGVFLSCGTVSDPVKGYRAEFSVSDQNLSKELYFLTLEMGLSPHLSVRGNNLVVYFTGNENVSDFLTFIGAGAYTLKIADITVYKDMRNRLNRITNCETANISKTVNAAVNQCLAIRKLKEKKQFAKLSEELQKVAELRLKYDQASLQELVELYDGEITKSGLNHRLKRLVTLAENIE
ncbi:MAG: DNA-binding protein WhiA [Clostridia bacterium]|nr:DNA-binding protein WhiA [Clostridia bacterium]